MPYTNIKNSYGSYSQLTNIGLKQNNSGDSPNTVEFYELEPAVVLDVIMDENHPEIKNKKHLIDVNNTPENYKGEIPSEKDIDYTWVGSCLVRLCFSQQGMPKEKLSWAHPLESTGVVEYPLLNEIVIVVKYFNKLFYTRKLNLNGFINNESDFRKERFYGINLGNRETNESNKNQDEALQGPYSLNSHKSIKNEQVMGRLGRYFVANPKIRKLKKYEGDTSIESRHGQSIRFSVYDDIRSNDKSSYIDYKGISGVNSSEQGCGNPMILIRNRQRKLSLDEPITVSKLPKIPSIKDSQKNVGGLIEEDINHDGSSIHITSGLTITKWVTTCYKSIFEDEKEEQKLYSPKSSTPFKFIQSNLSGDQIVINTDRLILSSRFGETFHFSKKRYGIVTDSEYTVDAHQQVVITTNTKTVINSPAIYLGQYNETNEPAILGQTAVDWLYNLCNWLLQHEHWYHHTHPKTGKPDPNKTQFPVQKSELEKLRDSLDTLLSKRVFLTGGGYAKGADGESIEGGTDPVKIDTISGNGVPGGYKGKNSRQIKNNSK